MEFTHGQMENVMTVDGNMESSTVKQPSQIAKENQRVDYGKMEKELSGLIESD